MKAMNEYVRGYALVNLDWETWETPCFWHFNSTLLQDFRETTITEGTLKLVREKISEKIEEINEEDSLRRKINSGIGFKRLRI